MADSEKAREAIRLLAEAMDVKLPDDFEVNVQLTEEEPTIESVSFTPKGVDSPVALFRFNNVQDLGGGVNLFRFRRNK